MADIRLCTLALTHRVVSGVVLIDHTVNQFFELANAAQRQCNMQEYIDRTVGQ